MAIIDQLQGIWTGLQDLWSSKQIGDGDEMPESDELVPDEIGPLSQEEFAQLDAHSKANALLEGRMPDELSIDRTITALRAAGMQDGEPIELGALLPDAVLNIAVNIAWVLAKHLSDEEKDKVPGMIEDLMTDCIITVTDKLVAEFDYQGSSNGLTMQMYSAAFLSPLYTEFLIALYHEDLGLLPGMDMDFIILRDLLPYLDNLPAHYIEEMEDSPKPKNGDAVQMFEDYLGGLSAEKAASFATQKGEIKAAYCRRLSTMNTTLRRKLKAMFGEPMGTYDEEDLNVGFDAMILEFDRFLDVLTNPERLLFDYLIPCVTSELVEAEIMIEEDTDLDAVSYVLAERLWPIADLFRFRSEHFVRLMNQRETGFIWRDALEEGELAASLEEEREGLRTGAANALKLDGEDEYINQTSVDTRNSRGVILLILQYVYAEEYPVSRVRNYASEILNTTLVREVFAPEEGESLVTLDLPVHWLKAKPDDPWN